MVDQKFLDELDHAFRHAVTICKDIFYRDDLDSICIKEDDDGQGKLKVEYTYSRGSGYSYDEYGDEFPIKYLTMTLDEIRVEEARIAKEEILKELAREAERKPKEIENIALNIKISQNSAEAYKKKYYELTGKQYTE